MGNCKGFCLVQNKETRFTFETDIGGLYTCPWCGLIEEKVSELKHVFEPSKFLLERLKGY